MSILQAIFLGIVQGLTEFLPVSSSGHLVFFQSVFGLREPQVFFDVMLHLGTLLAVLIFFRADISAILTGTLRALRGEKGERPKARLLLWIIVGTIPTGLIGVLFKDRLESLFAEPARVGIMLLVTGVILWLTRFVKRETRDASKMGWRDALTIGVAQGVAIIPGISRSGATISTGLFSGLDRELSGKFSFLLSIPAILGATLLEFRKIETPSEAWVTVVGMAAAFLVGFLSLRILMRMVRAGKLSHFSYYCWAVGILMIVLTGSL